MKINFCPNCGAPIHGPSRFCPKCGVDFSILLGTRGFSVPIDAAKDDIKSFIESFIENNADLLKELSARVEKGEGFKKGVFFAVEMKGDKPVIRSGDVKDLEKMIKHTSVSNPLDELFQGAEGRATEFKEATAEIKDEEGGRMICVKLPEVSNIEDVIINQISDGIEVIGRGKNRIYFSKINLVKPFEIKRSEIQNELLTIYVS